MPFHFKYLLVLLVATAFGISADVEEGGLERGRKIKYFRNLCVKNSLGAGQLKVHNGGVVSGGLVVSATASGSCCSSVLKSTVCADAPCNSDCGLVVNGKSVFNGPTIMNCNAEITGNLTVNGQTINPSTSSNMGVLNFVPQDMIQAEAGIGVFPIYFTSGLAPFITAYTLSESSFEQGAVCFQFEVPLDYDPTGPFQMDVYFFTNSFVPTTGNVVNVTAEASFIAGGSAFIDAAGFQQAASTGDVAVAEPSSPNYNMYRASLCFDNTSIVAGQAAFVGIFRSATTGLEYSGNACLYSVNVYLYDQKTPCLSKTGDEWASFE